MTQTRNMKILILNGSPRSNGLISRILDTMANEARQHHAEVEVVPVCRLDIHPCTGCMSCRSRHNCVLPEDDAQRTLAKIVEADALVIGSPCYWGNMSGQLKILFDRLVYGLMGESPKGFPLPLHKGKKAVIVSTGSTVKALREILKWSGFSVQGVLQKGGTKQHHELTMKELQKCKTLIKRLTI